MSTKYVDETCRQKSFRQKSFRPNYVDKMSSTKYAVDLSAVDEVSIDKMSVDKVLSTKYLSTNDMQFGETTIKLMHQISVSIWKTGKWPACWTDSLFIPLPKKGDLKQCSNYRTIALVSYARKIILERIRLKTEKEIAIEQARFRRGRGTRDQITNLRLLLEKAHEHQQLVFMCFIDFKKAFDSGSHIKLWTTMKNMGYPPHLIHLLAEQYRQQKAKVKVTGTVSESFHIKKGVRQGCVMWAYLFNIMAEMAMRETLDDFTGGIQIGGQEITNLRYVDDIVLMTQSEDKLQELVTRFDNACRNKHDLHINIDKTKVMATDGTSCCTYQDTESAVGTSQNLLISWICYRRRRHKQSGYTKQTSNSTGNQHIFKQIEDWTNL